MPENVEIVLPTGDLKKLAFWSGIWRGVWKDAMPNPMEFVFTVEKISSLKKMEIGYATEVASTISNYSRAPGKISGDGKKIEISMFRGERLLILVFEMMEDGTLKGSGDIDGWKWHATNIKNKLE